MIQHLLVNKKKKQEIILSNILNKIKLNEQKEIPIVRFVTGQCFGEIESIHRLIKNEFVINESSEMPVHIFKAVAKSNVIIKRI